nr:MAG TPA: hypothetical protein [Caudoviricetes sp.]
MYTAERENKVYTISELEVEYYRKQGFDIYNSEHELHARGVKVSVSGAVYNAALEEIEKLKAEIAELTSKDKGK